MTTDEIEALAKYLSDIGFRGKELANIREFMDACDKSAAALRHLMARVSELEKENADLKLSVVAFAGCRAVEYAKMTGLPNGQLHPHHYDILEKCGARMVDFTRAQDPIRSLKRPQEAI